MTATKIKSGKTYEIPGDGNDRFFAEADAFCPGNGVWRVVIQEPARWRGYWAGVAAADMKPVLKAA